MQLILFFITLICWISYSILQGKEEAWFFFTYSKRVNLAKDIHFNYTLQRGVVLLPILLINILPALLLPIWNIIIIAIALLMAFGFQFVFWHDGYYYLERNNQDGMVYKKRFCDYNDSSAKNDFTWHQRIIMFSISLAIIAVLIFEFVINK